jgi:hypothetical protein
MYRKEENTAEHTDKIQVLHTERECMKAGMPAARRAKMSSLPFSQNNARRATAMKRQRGGRGRRRAGGVVKHEEEQQAWRAFAYGGTPPENAVRSHPRHLRWR